MQTKSAILTLFAATTIITSAAATGGWLVREENSRLDDSNNVFLWTNSVEAIPDMFGRLVTPVLTLRCQENTSSFYVDWSTYLGIDENSRDLSHR